MAISVKIATAQRNPTPATSNNITDPEDDVLTLNANLATCATTDLHPELDIDTMVRSSQTFVITLHENFDTTSYHMYLLMIEDGSDEYTVTLTGGLGVSLMNPTSQFWGDSGWGTFPLVEVGSMSGDTLTINIPTDALTITNSMDWNFVSMYTDPNTGILYVDGAPDSSLPGYCPGYELPDGNGDGLLDDDGSSIPGYEFMTLLLITSFTASGIIYVYTKKNRFK